MKCPPNSNMRFTHLAITASFFDYTISSARFPPRVSCPVYTLLVARGTGELPGGSLGFSGLGIPGMVPQTLNQVPGGFEYDVIYPAASTLIVSQELGKLDVLRYIREARTSCPNQKFALLGYSQGVTVMLKALQALSDTADEELIKAVVFLGNPYHKKNQASTVDQYGGNSTVPFDGSLLFQDPDLALSDRLAKSGKVLDICYQGDLVCVGPRFDALNANHLLYPVTPSVQTLGRDFLVSKFK